MSLDVSIVIPTMNEEVTIKQFLDWCFEGFDTYKLNGEVVLLDSSSDRTPEIALESGAKVIKVPVKGLGNAYAAGQHQVLGKWIFMGDADCTYDFRNLAPFISKLNEGFDFVVGNRFAGEIEKGAMPIHHQYFGSPLTSLVFKFGLGLPVGDIHCGMRAMTKDLYNSLPYLEGGWEYATEMIVSARNLGANITEVPIKFFKEPQGRVSHHKRSSWLSPFKAGWGTLRVTVTYLIDRLFVIPGIILLGLSTVLNVLLFLFPTTFLNLFNVGLLAQAGLMFLSSMSSFALTNGLLAQFAYRRKLISLTRLAESSTATRLFSILVSASIIEVFLSGRVFYQWIHGIEDKLDFPRDNYCLISGWLSFTSIFLCILSVSIASLIGNHAQKFRR